MITPVKRSECLKVLIIILTRKSRKSSQKGIAKHHSSWYYSLCQFENVPKWWNRHTRTTQNRVSFAREGSTPSFGTIWIIFQQHRGAAFCFAFFENPC